MKGWCEGMGEGVLCCCFLFLNKYCLLTKIYFLTYDTIFLLCRPNCRPNAANQDHLVREMDPSWPQLSRSQLLT